VLASAILGVLRYRIGPVVVELFALHSSWQYDYVLASAILGVLRYRIGLDMHLHGLMLLITYLLSRQHIGMWW